MESLMSAAGGLTPEYGLSAGLSQKKNFCPLSDWKKKRDWLEHLATGNQTDRQLYVSLKHN